MAYDDTSLDKLKCPNCGELIPVSQTIYHQIAEQARADLRAEALERQKALAEKEKALEARENAVDEMVESRVNAAMIAREKEAEKKAREAVLVEVEDLKRQNAEREQKLQEAREAELQWRAQKRELEEREKNLELEAVRRLDAERKKIAEETAKRVEEEYRLREAEKDKQLQDAMRANDELRRKLQQGSQQTQGEVLELELEELIRSAFPADQIDPVAKGRNGADVIHKVFAKSGHFCGTMVWELKRTKSWSDGWIAKLKDDQRVTKAEIAILVSEALPKDCKHFGQISGVWVASPQCALGLAIALRQQLTEVAMTKLAAVGKNEKMEVLYQYLSGVEFKQRVEAIVEAFIEMQEDLQEERRVAEKRWSKREKQLQRVVLNTSGMYGDLQGLIGSSLEEIPALTASSSLDKAA